MSQELIGSQNPKELNEDSSSQGHTPYEIIRKKRDSKALTKAEIKWFIQGLVQGQIADYQMSALLMAIYLNGLSAEETMALTEVMLHSGKTINFNDPTVIDKHSTGGVGDKTSFIIAPIAAACGVKVPMIAGRGLGHTGGTIDKVEAIAGFKTQLTLQQFEQQLIEKGLVLMGQTEEIAPADKRIYALRDVTATIESIPLITASILSKKLAEGAQGIVMDIKTGPGAFMQELARAQALAQSIIQVAQGFKKHVSITISDMSQPLGWKVGHSLELIECVDTLKGQGPKDLEDLSIHLAAEMIYLAKVAVSSEQAKQMAKRALDDGSALAKFAQLITWQKGDPSFIDKPSLLPLAKTQTIITAQKTGVMTAINNTEIGLHCVTLGGGRTRLTDKIDHAVGLEIHKKLGDKIEAGEPLLTIHHHQQQTSLVEQIKKLIVTRDITISDQTCNYSKPPLIYETHTHWSSHV